MPIDIPIVIVGLGLVYLTKAVAIFHLGLYYEFDILG